ncbi:MAG TPA: restriction endonuclease [Solirubrobacterales bacterium]
MGEFDALSPPEFEDFVSDLLTQVTGIRFNAGTPGGDGGIDGLCVVDGERHVIQCKRFIRSDFKELKREARKAVSDLEAMEIPPVTYRFVTSLELSHDQRDELVGILEPWVGSRDNVLGGKELLAYLRDERYSAVATHHPKLWFQGVAQLRRQLSAEQYERRDALLEEIRPRLPRYVRTGAFESARRRLRENRVCIIDGLPGIGKTTLAQLLLLESLEEGYSPFELIRGQVGKAWELLDLDEKQVFYFDDFLGRTALHEARDDEADIVKFLRRIERDKRRRAILTTRDYIFTEAQRGSDALYEGVDGTHLVVLTPQGYSRVDRARILYNHLYFSPQLEAMEKASLVSSGRHLEVIDHEDFVPRKIERITGFTGRLRDEDRIRYGLFCVRAMNDPGNPWREPFDELDPAQQALLLGFLGLPDRVGTESLEQVFESACLARDLPADPGSFEQALPGLEGVFVERIKGSWFSLVNPSVLDFLERQVVTSRADTEATLRGAAFYDQVRWLWDAWRRGSELPPEHLWPVFDDAFHRVFDRVERSLPTWMGEKEGSHFRQELGSRLEAAAERLQHPWFREHSSDWLSPFAEEWMRGLGEGEEFIYSGEIELVSLLVEADLLGEEAIEEAKDRVRSMEPSLDRWRLLLVLRDMPGAALSREEVAEETIELESFVEWALAEPVEFYEEEGFYGTEGLDDLLELAAAWGVAPDEEDVWPAQAELLVIKKADDRANNEMDAWEREEEGEGEEEVDPLEPSADEPAEEPGAEDEEVEALFARFTEGSDE